MFRCSDRKLQWYLLRGLATPIPEHFDGLDSAKSIRLSFQPRGRGRNREGDEWYLEDQADRCVVCGEEEAGLTLHHVVPYQYRREMPLSYKSHGSHDVLVLCVRCHEAYEVFAQREKIKLARTYDAPLEGRGWIKNKVHGTVRTSACALMRYAEHIPDERIRELRKHIIEFYGLEDESQITEEILLAALDLKAVEKAPDFLEHSEIVVRGIEGKYGETGFAEFVRFWRKHFLTTMQPRFLSPRWRVDDPVNLVAGEYNPYRPEMDGS